MAVACANCAVAAWGDEGLTLAVGSWAGGMKTCPGAKVGGRSGGG